MSERAADRVDADRVDAGARAADRADAPARADSAPLDTDVVVIGAGPGGSAVAGYLAQRGVRAVVLEKDAFPRFHIGESLLTMSIPALAELGVDLARADYALRKNGALFRDDASHESLRIDFAHALEGTHPFAYQVERQHFDHALARRASELGADVRFETEVKSWSEHEDGIEVRGDFGACRARFLVDATGQQALIGRRARSMRALDRFGRCASFSTFGNVTSETFRASAGNGDIVIHLCAAGWMWLIPLPRARVSIGLVEREPRPGSSAEETLREAIASSAFLREFLVGAERIAPYRRISNYSYYNVEPATPRCVAVGDARAFLDPIFSSGVTIAVLSARMLAHELASALAERRTLELDAYTQRCTHAYTTFDRLIERFYRPEWVRNVFFASAAEDRLVRELTAILAGDVWRDDNAIQRMLLQSRPRTGFGSADAPQRAVRLVTPP